MSAKAEAGSPADLDAIQKAIGDFGKYQYWLSFIVFISKVPVAWHQMGIIFLAPKVSFTCDGELNKCPCENPVYDRSIFTKSIIMRWNLICDNRWLTSIAQMVFQLGTLTGSILFGMLSDRFGRRPPLIAAVLLQTTTGTIAAFVPEFWMFNVFRLLDGMACGGILVVGFVLLMEYAGTTYRPPLSALYHVPFNVGHLTLPIFGHFFRDYSNLQLAISLPVLILGTYFCLLPETPRWLIAMKKTEDVVTLCEKVAKINGLPTDTIRSEINAYQAVLEKRNLKKGSVADIFRTPNLRKNMLAMAYSWLTCGYCFYGVSQYISHLTGNIFVNVASSAAVTLIGAFVSVPLISVMNRRTMLITFQTICAVCLYMLAFIPESTASIVCASIGNVAAFIVFILVYLYCSELFPTVVRNAAIGFASMSARFGSMIAPFVVELRDRALWMPAFVFALLPTIGILISFLLPETKGCELMTTLEEGEAFGKKPSAVPKA